MVIVIADEDHWVAWHESYEDPSSSLSHRLVKVQGRLSAAIDAAPSGPISLISACAGEGRDVLGVLASHPRAPDVRAVLVELDHALVVRARAAANALNLDQVDVVEGDAATTSAYATHVPAHVALFCGIFGNVTEDDVHETVSTLPSLLAPGATVIWTRHTQPPDLTGAIRSWFAETGFDEVGFDTEEGRAYGVGTHVLARPPDAFVAGRRMFRFIGDGSGAAT